jgi:peptidoglycan/xylan/chitin deacetylase (PgdA/CDA1 family)
MLKKFKQATLKSLKTSGVFRLVQNSEWRRQQLLILAYHGISLEDEHRWDGSLFMHPEDFRKRLQIVKKLNCTVLPLNEAIERLYAQDLPDRAVALTFDDGTYDFYEKANPIIQEFGFPVTLYLTTFYAHYNRPVFNVTCSYLLWKGHAMTLDMERVTNEPSRIALGSESARAHAFKELQAFVNRHKLSAEEKDALAAKLAAELKVDYDELLAKRILHLVTPEEVKSLSADGVDIQLHTHRHRTPLDRELFLREIEDNRKSIAQMTGTRASHFCYPSGVYDREFLPWLEEKNVLSATTCELGFATKGSHKMLLPRLLDTSGLAPIEFEGWLTGIASVLPRRREAGARVA